MEEKFQVGRKVKFNPIYMNDNYDDYWEMFFSKFKGREGVIVSSNKNVSRVMWQEGDIYFYSNKSLIVKGVDYDE